MKRVNITGYAHYIYIYFFTGTNLASPLVFALDLPIFVHKIIAYIQKFVTYRIIFLRMEPVQVFRLAQAHQNQGCRHYSR